MNQIPSEEIAELQLRSIRGRYTDLDEPAAHALLESKASQWEPIEVHATHGPRGLQGFIALNPPRESRFGVAGDHRLDIVLDPDADAFAWADEILGSMASRLPDPVSARVDADYRPVRESLERLGFGVTKLGLCGSVERALRSLRERNVVDPASLGLRVEPVRTHEDVLATVELCKGFFRAHPEYSWAPHRTIDADEQRRIDERLTDELERRRRQNLDTDFVVVDSNGVVVGAFGFRPRAAYPIGGSTAGIRICLTEPIQGRGMGRAAYVRMLERADEIGIETIRGDTSNPAVIHLAAAQHRHLDNWLMRRTPPFIARELWDYPRIG